MNTYEQQRLVQQAELDKLKTSAERNKMGQFATPTELAVDLLQYAKGQLGKREGVRFIDPAIGTGSFYSALLSVFPKSRVRQAVGFEIDPHYGEPAQNLWGQTGLDLRIQDFTKADPPKTKDAFNLLICNPPYVRHHHIVNGDKLRLKTLARQACGMEISGLAGLYCYYLALCHQWLKDDGLAGWLIPSEFMNVNYGSAVKSYLLDKVTLLHIHRFDPNDVQFGDALVSSAIVWFRKSAPPSNHAVRFTYGGSLREPGLDRLVPASVLRRDSKWTRYPMKQDHVESDAPALSEFFEIKRGLATGNNGYFILSADEIKSRGLPTEFFRPILPSPRYLTVDEVEADTAGNPVLEQRLFLLDSTADESEIKAKHPALWSYLEEGKQIGIDKTYLCSHRAVWYSQENRPASPFLCTYFGRSDFKDNRRPFRFILNHSRATATNVYLMLYPKEPLASALRADPGLKTRVWEVLNKVCPQSMLGEGRVYGGGLHKLEPRELGNVSAQEIADLLPEHSRPSKVVQQELFAAET